MKQIDIYQAMWGMEDIPNPQKPYSVEKKLQMIEEAGFAGALSYIDDTSKETLEESYRVFDLIKESPLKIGVSCHGNSLEDMKQKIDYTKKIGGEFLNIMVRDYYIRGEEALQLLEETINYGIAKGVKVFIETHRGTVTQDLLRAVDYVEELEQMRVTIDFSHYFVACEIDVVTDKVEEHFGKLLERAASIHVRVSNGEQVQLSLSRISDELMNHYTGWWKTAIKNGQKELEANENFPVVVELGPENYHQKHLVDGVWTYDGDRWEDALKWKEIFEQM